MEGKAGGQPAQADTDPSLESRNPPLGSIRETSQTPTPKQEVVEKTLIPSEHTSDRFYKHVFIVRAQFNRHPMRRNPNLRLRNRSVQQIIISKEILLMLMIRDIDGTGRPPECASLLLFHVPSSSIRGSPGSFVVFLIIGDFVRCAMQGLLGPFIPLSS